MNKQPEPPSTQPVTVQDLVKALKNAEVMAVTLFDHPDTPIRHRGILDSIGAATIYACQKAETLINK